MCMHVYRYIFEPTNTFSYHQYNDILILYNSTAHNVNI